MTVQNRRIFASVLIVAIVVGVVVLLAPSQIGDPPPPPRSGPAVPGLPIDGGVIIGAIVALLYGGKKIVTLKK